MPNFQSELDRVAKRIQSALSKRRPLSFPGINPVHVTLAKGTSTTDRLIGDLSFAFDGELLPTQMRFFEFSNCQMDEAYGIAVQQPYNFSSKFTRLTVQVLEGEKRNEHRAEELGFRLTSRDLHDATSAKRILDYLGYHTTKSIYNPAIRSFDALDQDDVGICIPNFLRFTLVLMCYRRKGADHKKRLRDDYRLLTLLGDKLDKLADKIASR
jgi:hypothetical protein